MAIRFRHDASGLVGAFAAGEAESRRRAEKYSMAMLMEQFRYNQRLGLAGARQGAARGGVPRPAGVWNDPLAIAGDAFLDPAERVQREAARRARDRKARLGNDIPSAWKPTYTSPWEIEQRQKQAEEQRKWAHEGEVRGQEWERADAIRKAEQEQKDAAAAADAEAKVRGEERAFSRRQLEEGPYSDEQRRAANKILSEMELARGNNKLSPEEQAAAVAIKQAEFDKIMANPTGVPKMSLPERWGQDILTTADGSKYQWLGPEKGWSEIKSSGAAAANKQGEEEAKVAKQKDDAIIKKYNEYRKEVSDPAYEGPLKGKDDDALFMAAQKEIAHEERRRAELNAIRQGPAPPVTQPLEPGFQRYDAEGRLVKPQPAPAGEIVPIPNAEPLTTEQRAAMVKPIPSARPLTEEQRSGMVKPLNLDNLTPQYLYGGKLHDAPRPVPAGMPAGSRWLDDNTMQLPDGRLIRRKGR